jgi:Uma2 family endonuclease
MNVQLPVHLDKPTFLTWIQGREERYELVAGHVVMMPGASRDHGMIVGNLYVELRRQLDRSKWSVIAEFGLDSGPDTLRYPDIVVDRANAAGKDHTAAEPVFLAEVLSPSTTATDLGDKAAEYLQIPSLVSYLVLSQDEPKAWLWTRRNGQFAPGADIVAGIDAVFRIPALGLEMLLAEIYAGIEFT